MQCHLILLVLILKNWMPPAQKNSCGGAVVLTVASHQSCCLAKHLSVWTLLYVLLAQSTALSQMALLQLTCDPE